MRGGGPGRSAFFLAIVARAPITTSRLINAQAELWRRSVTTPVGNYDQGSRDMATSHHGTTAFGRPGRKRSQKANDQGRTFAGVKSASVKVTFLLDPRRR